MKKWMVSLVSVFLMLVQTGCGGVCAFAAEAADGSSVPPLVLEDWRLILVNDQHAIPEGYDVSLLELTNGTSVDERIYPELQSMFDDARAEGLLPMVREGYRTTAYQEEIMESRVLELLDQGYSEEEARQKAQAAVAKPGYSEHELGLAVDINAVEGEDPWGLYEWLAENAWKYGFILRYPSGKEEITGKEYEPWHYRYVGEDAAQEIYEQGISLEEYLGVPVLMS